jgi:heme/copper-type cytochrome/quinol oxidase subunit 3
MGQRLVFSRRRGFTPLTLLVAALDLAAIAAAAALWWVVDAERHGENMPWVFGATVVLALVGLVGWAVSAGRRREPLAASTILLIAAVLIALFG